jgi:hypothetical protein
MIVVPQPEKTALDAGTDQTFAWAREMLDGLSGAAGEFIRDMSAGMAGQIRTQFPGVDAGRLVMAVTEATKALAEAMEDMGLTPTADVMLCITALAALELEGDGHS